MESRKAPEDIPEASPGELKGRGAVIFGSPTMSGNMCAQMMQFLDATGGLRTDIALIVKNRQRVYKHRTPARRAGRHHYRGEESPAANGLEGAISHGSHFAGLAKKLAG